MARLILSCCASLILVLQLNCGGRPPPPKRGVLEHHVGDWLFRRYQQVLDVEVYISKNPAVGHTASYVRKAAEKRGHLDEKDVVNAVVMRYERDDGVLREVIVFARRLAQESGYTVDETSIAGARVILVKGHGELWALWPAMRHVVKVGGRAVTSIPKKLVEVYAERYPSRLASGALEGPLPPRKTPAPGDKKEKYDPDSPTPDWDKYKPEKLPGNKK